MTPEERSHLRYLIFQAEQSFDNPHSDTLDKSIKNLTLRQVEDIALDYVEDLLAAKDAEIAELKAQIEAIKSEQRTAYKDAMKDIASPQALMTSYQALLGFHDNVVDILYNDHRDEHEGDE